jgi:hypothetical protein
MQPIDLLTAGVEFSEPFTLGADEAVALVAYGLQAGEVVHVELVTVTRGGPRGTVCCPSPVTLPEVQGAVPLSRCPGGAPIQLTETAPWALVYDPRGAPLRVRLSSSDLELSQVLVTLAVVSRAARCCDCT